MMVMTMVLFRACSELLHALEQLKQELPSELSTAFGELRTEAEKFLQSVSQVVGHLTTGHIDPQAVLESIPELESKFLFGIWIKPYGRITSTTFPECI